MNKYALEAEKIIEPMVGHGAVRRMIARVPGSFSASEDFNDARMVVFLRPWVEREEKTQDVVNKRSEEHTSELQSLMRISYAVCCLNKKNNHSPTVHYTLSQ